MSEKVDLEFENPQEYALMKILAGDMFDGEIQWVDEEETVGIRYGELEKPILQVVVDGAIVTTVVRDKLSSTEQLQRLVRYHTRQARGEVDEEESPDTTPAWH